MEGFIKLISYSQYKKNVKKYKRKILFFQIFIFISFLFVWQYFVDNNIINSFITSSPKEIIKTIINQ